MEQIQNEDKEKNKRKQRISTILSIIAIIISVTSVLDRSLGFIYPAFTWIKANFQDIINVMNLIVGFVGFLAFAVPANRSYKVSNLDGFKSLAELDDEEGGEPSDNELKIITKNLKERVDLLIRQFKNHLAGFSASLFFVYIAIIVNPHSAEIERAVNPFFYLTNFLNLAGGIFIHLAFIVLHDKTVKDTNKEITKIKEKIVRANLVSTNYWRLTAGLSGVYIFICICVTLALVETPTVLETINLRMKHVLNIADLIVGLSVGMAMTLLFGRFVSIEQSIKETKVFKRTFKPKSKIPYKKITTWGITLILPIYALAQPLFGSLRIDAFGNSDVFQTWVFTICLIGKIFLLSITYVLLRSRAIHLYLFGVVSRIGNFKKLELLLSRVEEDK